MLGAVCLGCVGGADPPPQPSLESLGLSSSERESYAAIGFDSLIDALEIAGDDAQATEEVIERVNRKTVGWSGTLQGVRLVKKGLERSEFALAVAPPSRADRFFPTTVEVLVETPNDAPLDTFTKGDPVVFVGRLEFDGRTREPWVVGARLLDASPD